MRLIKSLLLIAILSTQLNAHYTVNPNNLIQIAILLDTSNSMDGLIDQAKAQLWNIANEITNTKRDGRDVKFEFALYEYGNDRIPDYKQHVKQIVSFTSDMDLISEKLFALTTNGGAEYCGQVIHNSISELTWSKEAGLKAIYIAGNESFAQGSYPYKTSCGEANESSIKINTIFCGDSNSGIELQWHTAASITRGNYNNINQNSKTVHIDSPYDDDISNLNKKLNETYISYTESGKRQKLNQTSQDNNASEYGRANFAKRAIFKSKSGYDNSSWDLVDAESSGKDVYKYNEQLPASFQSKSKEELSQKIAILKEKRKSIKSDIACLAKERETFIKEAKRNNTIKSNPFEAAIISSLRDQLKGAGFTIKQ